MTRRAAKAREVLNWFNRRFPEDSVRRSDMIGNLIATAAGLVLASVGIVLLLLT